MKYKEIEVRFLNINKDEIILKLQNLGAKDKGSDFFKEIIFYDNAGTFKNQHRFIRLRETKHGAFLTYKQHNSKYKEISKVEDVDEVETKVSDPKATRILLENIGFEAFRVQEKRRHSFVLNGTLVEIDEWPNIPAYVEIEGKTENDLKNIATLLELDWSDVYFGSARNVIEKVYNTPVSDYKYFTFDKVGY